MEEVDSIILHFLRQLSINIDEDIKSLCDLSVQTIVEAASICVRTINPSVKVPAKLPPGVSQRIEYAAQIAAVCKDLGYKNDVGYQTFLYYNEAELRQVFMFLIERLPSEGSQTKSSQPISEKSLLSQCIGQKIAEELNSIWIPPCCNNLGQIQNNIGDYHLSTGNQIKLEPKLERRKDPPSTSSSYYSARNQNRDLDNQGVSSSAYKIGLSEEEIIEKLKKVKELRRSHTSEQLTIHQDKTEDKTPALETNPPCEINRSLKDLKESAIVLRQKLDSLESERNVMDVEYSQAQKSSERAEADLKNLESILESVGVHDTEGNIDNLLQRVQKNIEALHGKSEELTSRNISLKLAIDKLRNTSSESGRNKCKQILISLKENAKAMKAEYENKEQIRDQLKIKYEKLQGGNKRSLYTKRIMEIISNVDKQNLEIQKILEDTRQLQKEINALEGQLDRCFSIADETLFKDAKKDDQAKKAYKLLALLHSECNSIVSLVNDTGTIARDIIDLEDNINTEAAKRTEHTLQKIQQDLDRMQQETAVET